jgi:hypothetical protein
VLVAHVCNAGYLGGREHEGHGTKPVWAFSSQDPVSKVTNTENRAVAQVIECLSSKWETLTSKPSATKKKKSQEGKTGPVWRT